MAWKMSIWARLLDGNRAHTIFRHLINKNNCTNMFTKCFSTPQVEGVFGAAAGIAEMILQSHDGAVEFLPALPDAWPEGRIRGLRARGGFIVDFEWDDLKLESIVIHATQSGKCRVKYGDTFTEFVTRAGKNYTLSGKLQLQ